MNLTKALIVEAVAEQIGYTKNQLLRFSTCDILGCKIHGIATPPIFHVRCSVPSAPL